MNGGSKTLPRFQSTYNTLISELNDINEHLHAANNGNGDGDDVNDHDQIDFNNLHHDTLLTFDKLPSPIANDALIDTNGNSETIYDNGNHHEHQSNNDENIIAGDGFSYKTLNGDMIRSVHPPGKGSSANYKVSV